MNEKIATILRELAVLYDLKGVPYKPRAFERAADALEAAGQDAADVYRSDGIDGLEQIPGIGEGIAERIEEFLTTKHIAEYDRMKKVLPVDIAGITAVEGIGPKTLKLLFRKLGIRTLAQLEHAARRGDLAKIRGIGEREQANIIRALEYKKESGKRKLPGLLWPYLKTLTDKLEGIHGVKELEIVGSYRRMQETIGDLDLLAIADDPERVLHAFVELPQVRSVYKHGTYNALVRLKNGMDADLWVLPPESYGAALIAWTGDKAHNIHLRTIAKKKGLMLDDFGLFKGKTMVAGKTEEDVYKKLGMDWIPPEMRTDAGEIEAAMEHALPDLVGYADLRGDLQVQTDWTDGEHSILRMAQAAEAVGLEYIAITDHTQALAMTGGLDEKTIRKQWAEIDRVQTKVPRMKILKGTECDIHKDGSLDLDDRTLAQLDVVGVSVHSHFDLSERDQTQRLITAMENPHADIVCHPTGRKINTRAPIRLDMATVIAAAKRTKTVLEVDADPNRLDLKDAHIRLAVDAGVRIAVDSDAHSTDHYSFLRWGIGQARRGWAAKKDVVNTRPWREMLKLLK
ncbi:MAG TPA: DNA polymerase/3'-5' exonuclease PolX [Candidatus Paceibacterota bacterium]|nr:DNA polymerase/3'-5' exonuclease PolX [Candidatus Paceibacterota bacterium]